MKTAAPLGTDGAGSGSCSAPYGYGGLRSSAPYLTVYFLPSMQAEYAFLKLSIWPAAACWLA